MFSSRTGSFNELEQQRGCRNWKRWLGNHDLPSPDSLADVSEKMNCDDLHDCLGHIYHCLNRNKILQSIDGWMVAVIDGHEIGASYHRSCENCLEREIEVGGEKRIQYYNRLVALQIISANGYQFFLDMEMQLPGEDEVAAAHRLLERVIKNHPRSFDILLTDAIYLRPSTLELLRGKNKHLVSVLKANQPELLEEARTLMETEPIEQFEQSRAHSRKTVSLRDMEGFTTDTITEPLRIVWSNEVTEKRERINKEWREKTVESDWFWATTMDSSLASTKSIFKLGHDRWRIENEGFNELTSHWHADHYFHHHHNSIEVLWLILFMAHATFHCFYRRNLKPEIKKGHTVIYFGRRMAAEIRVGNWWPPPPV